VTSTIKLQCWLESNDGVYVTCDNRKQYNMHYLENRILWQLPLEVSPPPRSSCSRKSRGASCGAIA